MKALLVLSFLCLSALLIPGMAWAAEVAIISPQSAGIGLAIAVVASIYGLVSRQFSKCDVLLILSASLLLVVIATGQVSLLAWLAGLIVSLILLAYLVTNLMKTRRHRNWARFDPLGSIRPQSGGSADNMSRPRRPIPFNSKRL